MAIYQCYFSPDQCAQMFNHRPYVAFGLELEVNPQVTNACPELKTKRNRMLLAEYGAMLHLWRNPQHDGDDWIGFTSYRQLDKCRFELQIEDIPRITQLLKTHDVLGWQLMEFPTSLMDQAESCHTGIAAFMAELLRQFDCLLPLAYLKGRKGLYCNYWIMSKHDFNDFMEWSFPMIQWCLDHCDDQPFLRSHPRSVGFVMERLFIVWYMRYAKSIYNLNANEPVQHQPTFARRVRQHGRICPGRSLHAATRLFDRLQGRTIVELGVLSHLPGDAAFDLFGGSTLIWAECSRAESVYCIDTDSRAIETLRRFTGHFKHVKATQACGIQFLSTFTQPIDLLYLDAWDLPAISGDRTYQLKHLEAFRAALHRLHSRSLVLIDDTDMDNGGKGAMIVHEATALGFSIWWRGRQTLLSRARPQNRGSCNATSLDRRTRVQ